MANYVYQKCPSIVGQKAPRLLVNSHCKNLMSDDSCVSDVIPVSITIPTRSWREFEAGSRRSHVSHRHVYRGGTSRLFITPITSYPGFTSGAAAWPSTKPPNSCGLPRTNMLVYTWGQKEIFDSLIQWFRIFSSINSFGWWPQRMSRVLHLEIVIGNTCTHEYAGGYHEEMHRILTRHTASRLFPQAMHIRYHEYE